MTGEKITISAGKEFNAGDHEDGDEGFTANKDLEAEVVGTVEESGSLKVVIPEVDPDRQFFIHQPPKKEKS